VNVVKVRRPKSSSDVAAAQSAALRPWFANTRADCVTADDRRCRWLSERGEGSWPKSSSDVAAAQSAALRPWFANTRADCVTADDRRCRWLSERGGGSPPEIQFGRCCGSECRAPALVCKHKSGLCNCWIDAAVGSVNAVEVRRPKSSSDVAAAQSAALRPWFANTRADCVTAG
jgi:hypothetical protein